MQFRRVRRMKNFSQRSELDHADPDYVARLIGIQRSGNRYWCPFCQNDGKPHSTPDLSHPPGDGRWRCFRCGWGGSNYRLAKDCGAMLSLENTSPAASVVPKKGKEHKIVRFDTLEEAISSYAKESGGQVVGIWRYNEAVAVVRLEKDGQKTYRPFHVSSLGGWIRGAPKPPRPLYIRYSGQMVNSDVIIVVEGEKCVDAVCWLGFDAATSMGGASAANNSDWTPIVRRKVLVIPDNDAAGYEYAKDVRAIITTAGGKAFEARLPGGAKGSDIADYAERCGKGWARAWILDVIRRANF